MNQAEATAVIGFLSRAGLVRIMEGQGDVWADVLPDIRADDAVVVARQLGRTNIGADRWVTPGDIRAGVNELRRQRHLAADKQGALTLGPPETIDPTRPALEQAWRRAFNAAIGDGADVAGADVIACAEVHATRAAIGTRDAAALIDAEAAAERRIPRRSEITPERVREIRATARTVPTQREGIEL
jgi:hypothetical protein